MKLTETNSILWSRIGLSVLLFIFLGCDASSEGKQSKQLIEQCKEVKIGMTRSEVIGIMGEPRNTVDFQKDGIDLERIYYPSPRHASSPTQFLVNKESNLVEEVICGDNYSRTKK